MGAFEDRASPEFAKLAIQYYVAGRFLASGRQMPVAGTVLHHAIEMLLKAMLVQSIALAYLKDDGHSLPKLWARAIVSAPELADPENATTIAELDRFEVIRYPDRSIINGAAVLLSFAPGRLTGDLLQRSGGVPKYVLRLPGVDRLFAALFNHADANPKVFIDFLSEATRKVIEDDNAHPFW